MFDEIIIRINVTIFKEQSIIKNKLDIAREESTHWYKID